MTNEAVLPAALAWHGAAASPIQIRADGSKAPAFKWEAYQTKRATVAQLRKWFTGTAYGLGVVMGYGGYECLDFDSRDIWELYCATAKEVGLKSLVDRVATGYGEYTPNGVHLIWRCKAVEGNQKLAAKLVDGKQKAAIETRGIGGQVVVAPSNGKVHPSGLPYELKSGSPATVAELTPDDRAELLALARSLDRCPPRPAEPSRQPRTADGGRPGDRFNGPDGPEWADILGRHGWVDVYTADGLTHWRRPGKADRSTSATTGVRGEGGDDLLYVFSTNAEPFEAGRSYTKFGAYAVLDHGGDFKAATKQLASEIEASEPAVDSVDSHLNRVAKELASLRARDEAQRLFTAEVSAQGWSPDTLDLLSGSLDTLLTRPRETPPYLVDELFGHTHNVLLAAQYKTGKTTFGVNLLRALVDELPFLDRETNLPSGGRVAWTNGEMDADDLADYLRPMKIKHTKRIAVSNLRGQRLPLLNDHIAEAMVKWLRTNDIVVWGLDSFGRAAAWSRTSENKNEEVSLLLERIDAIKAEAGVLGFIMLAHTGRATQLEGEEHVRGATVLDDWPDARWIMTKDREGTRFLYAEGRKVAMSETALVFDPLRYHISLGEGNRRSAAIDALREQAVGFIANNPGATGTAIQEALGGKKDGRVAAALRAAERDGEVYSIPVKPRGAHWHLGRKPEASPP